MNELGKRIKELRLLNNISQPQLAKAIGVSNGIISQWENGKVEPKACYICELVKFFNVSADCLLGLSNEQGQIIINSMLNDTENHLLAEFRKLKSDMQSDALNYISFLISKSLK